MMTLQGTTVAKQIGQATIPSNLDIVSKLPSAFKNNNNSYALRIGVVLQYYPVDDDENASKTTPEYDVYVLEDNNQQVVYRRCQFAGGGSLNDFGEHILQTSDSALKGDLKIGNDLQNLTGSFVVMLCLDGKREKAKIIQTFQHGSYKSKATKAMGKFLEKEFQGFNLLLDKDGNFKLALVGIKDDKGAIINSDPIGSMLNVTKDGIISILDNKGQMFKLDRVAQLITITDGSGESIVIDKQAKTLQIDVGKDEIQNIGQNYLSTIKKDSITKISGEMQESVEKNKTESSGPRKTTVNGAWQIKAQTLKVDASDIELVSSGPVNIQAQTAITLMATSMITLNAPTVNVTGALNVSGALGVAGGFSASGGGGGSITGSLTVSGSVSAGALTASGAVSGASGIFTGSVSASSVSATGAIVGGSVMAGSVDLATHTHSGVTPGGGNSGPPN